jgi:hypothetical protein
VPQDVGVDLDGFLDGFLAVLQAGGLGLGSFRLSTPERLACQSTPIVLT